MTYHDIYSSFRAHISVILIGGAAVTVAWVPGQYSLYVMLFWAAVAAWLMIGAHYRTRRASRRFLGKMIEFVYAPTPMGSLIQSLQKHGVTPENIDTVELMSADVGDWLRYFENGGTNGVCAFLDTMKRCPEMKVKIYGRSNSEIMDHAGITIVRTKDRYVEHVNLVTTKDQRAFVWFEPYHNVISGKHYFTHGAYLFAISEQTAKQIRNKLESLPLAQAA